MHRPLSGEQKRRIEEARREYELQRFDIVKQINDIDCAKKLQLSKVCCSLQAFVANCSKSLQGALAASDEAFVEKRRWVRVRVAFDRHNTRRPTNQPANQPAN